MQFSIFVTLAKYGLGVSRLVFLSYITWPNHIASWALLSVEINETNKQVSSIVVYTCIHRRGEQVLDPTGFS